MENLLKEDGTIKPRPIWKMYYRLAKNGTSYSLRSSHRNFIVQSFVNPQFSKLGFQIFAYNSFH
jgi:hypothetical protein